MNLSVTFRHMEATDAIKDYCKERLEKIKRYFPDPITAHVVLSTERGYQHCVDVVITLHNGLFIKGVEATEDMYSSIDLVMAKIERQVRRYKERIRDHKPSAGPLRLMRHRVVEDTSAEQAPSATTPPPAPGAAPRIIKEEKYVARPL